ncbi:MAG: patatin-like phospholipase family protein [Acidimicrobiia bacterium]|nr:MAG: patatin-like phospholipase family protein [Acidimicrobiia bacterium]
MDGLASRSSALVLTGGGNRGAIQAGAVLALFEQGFRPDLIIGVSVGAINGALLSFYPTVYGVHRMLHTWRGLDGHELFGTGSLAWRGLAAFVLGRPAAYSNQGLRDLLLRRLPSRRFSDTTVPFVAVATNLETGVPVYLSDGDLIQAVLASAAIPVHLPPVRVQGQLLVDGAIADPAPIQIALDAGATQVVVVEPGHACDCPKVYDNAASIFSQSIAIMARGILAAELDAAEGSANIIHLALTCHADIPMTDLSRASEMIDSGYQEASRWLDSHADVWTKSRVS